MIQIKSRTKKQLILHSMLLPGTLLLLVFNVLPMLGIWMAFSKYQPKAGMGYFEALFSADYVGFAFFQQIFSRPDFKRVLFNTVFISVVKLVLLIGLGILLSLLLNEIPFIRLKKGIQVIVFIPYFLSWVILSSIMIDLLSLTGPINRAIEALGGKAVSFLGSNTWFPFVLFVSELWKSLGYQAIYFLAAITAVSPGLYEAAEIDGANRVQQCFHVTLPCIRPIIILMVVLNIGNIMNAVFEQVLALYNPLVYESGDIIDTMSYRIGLINRSTFQYSLGTAVGLFKSVICCILFGASYLFAAKKLDYEVL